MSTYVERGRGRGREERGREGEGGRGRGKEGGERSGRGREWGERREGEGVWGRKRKGDEREGEKGRERGGEWEVGEDDIDLTQYNQPCCWYKGYLLLIALKGHVYICTNTSLRAPLYTSGAIAPNTLHLCGLLS